MMGSIDPQTREIVVSVLKKAALKGGPIRLYRKGKSDGLFPERFAASGDIENYCLAGDNPLLLEPESKEKVSAREVVIGPGGLDYLIDHLEPSEFSRWLSEELKGVTKRYDEARRQWTGVVAQNDAVLRALEEIHQRAVSAQKNRARILELKILDGPIEVSTEKDFEIARRFGVHLVNTLRLEGPLEAVLLNTGFERIGQTDDRVAFSPRIHISESSIVPGDPVLVETSGWMLRMDKIEHVLEKARVRPIE